MRTTFFAAVLAAAGLAAPAYAQETADEPPIQAIEIHGVRDPAMAPYELAYEMLTGVRKVTDGKVDLLFRVLSSKTLQPIPDLQVALKSDATFEKLAPAPDGFITIPLNEQYLAEKAYFVTNKKEGSVRVEQFLVPVLPQQNLTYGDINGVIQAGNRGLVKVVPWYLRMLVDKVRVVQLCYPDKGQQIALGTGTSRPAADEQKNPLNRKTVYCAAFDDRETAAAPRTAIDAPPGYAALFK